MNIRKRMMLAIGSALACGSVALSQAGSPRPTETPPVGTAEFDPIPGASFGYQVVALGDVDGDGLGDFAVGAPWAHRGDAGGPRRGEVWAVSGATGDALWCVVGARGGGAIGSRLASGTDVNGDGIQDVVVGTAVLAPTPPSPQDPRARPIGRVLVLSGSSGEYLLDILEPAPGTNFGSHVAGVGDLDGDGHGDIAVSHGLLETIDPISQGWRYVAIPIAGMLVYSGRDASVLLDLTWPGGRKAYTPYPIAGCGDVTGDGVPDLLAAGDASDGYARAVRVFSGADGRPSRTVEGEPDEHDFADALAAVGDVNADGVVDFAVGHPYDDVSDRSPPDQSVRIYSGLDGRVLHYLHYPDGSNERRFGESISAAGDVNLDGCDDVLISAPGTWEPWGIVRVFSGHDGAVIHEFGATGSEEAFGIAIAGIGDVTGDGVPDVAIGTAMGHNPDAQASVRVYSGSDGSLFYQVQRSRRVGHLRVR